MNKEYNLKLDLQFKCNNSKMIFDEFDENTSDFFMQINRQGEKVDISNAIPTLLVLKPSGIAVSQILNVKDNLIYGNLNNSLKNEVGTYIAKLMLIEGDKKTFISNISYEVTENALLGKIDNDIVEDERYSVLLQLLERLSNIELQEQTRVDNESSRIEAENLREESIEKIKNDIDFLVNETNKKVSDNLNSNTSKIDNLIIDTKEELNKYKENKDKFINEDLEEFKENTNKSIDNYKASKDIEINNILNTYKTNTTNDINNFKNTVNSKIDKYKNDKDKAINEYIEAKELELDNYVEVKSNELDLYVSEKNALIDSKISEVDSAKTQIQDSINNKLIEVDNAEQIRQQEHESRQQFLNGFEGKLNTVVDDVATIKDDVVSVKEANKRQDILIQGLYNENLDSRVTIKEEGSVISLTNSDDGLIDIIGLEGNTLVNYVVDGSKELTLNGDIEYNAIIKPSTQYTVAFDTNTSGEVGINLGGSKVTTTNNVATVTTPSTLTDDSLRLTGKGVKVSKVRLLEGDKTNYIPSYFEGLQSSFEEQVEEDKYKIEILSQNRNLFNVPSTIKEQMTFTGYNNSKLIAFAKVKNDTTYRISGLYTKSISQLGHGGIYVGLFKDKPNSTDTWYNTQNSKYVYKSESERVTLNTTVQTGSYNYIGVYVGIATGSSYNHIATVTDLQLEQSSTTTQYTQPKFNKIKLLINEPLRGVGDVKDRFVFKDGKLMIERNCGSVVLNGSEDWTYWKENTGLDDRYKSFYIPMNNHKDNFSYKLISNTLLNINSTLWNRILDGNSVALNENKKISLQIAIRKNELSTQDISGFKQWLQENPTTVVYQLAEPTYEPILFELQRLILECYENGTLFLDTNIPPTVEASYTANIPLVSKVNKVNETAEINTEDIAITQMAVDFLLMSTLGEEMLSFKVRSGYNMASYFASRIIKGALKYEDVVNKYPQYKEDINLILVSEGYSNLIAEL